MKRVGLAAVGAAALFGSLAAPAQDLQKKQKELEDRIKVLEQFHNAQAAGDKGVTTNVTYSPGDNAWMLVSCALVLMMTGPGLALFYGGLVRRKNVLSTMMHSLFLMALISVLWAIYGYSMAFAEGNSFCGNPLTYFLLHGVGAEPHPDYGATVPHQTYMLFQLMFAVITPALISGAYAERVKFSAMVVFTILWATIVYFPLAHMVWGKGGYFNWAIGGRVPALDFAGGTVVHISSGVSALVFALVLGKRIGFPSEPMPPHNLVYSLTGAALLWVGWFGFNAGSAVNAGPLATSAFAATHFATAAAAIGWGGAEWLMRGKPSALGVASGMVAGLVAVTPASGFVSVPSALAIGLAAGVICFLAVSKVKSAFGYDDALDAFGVHGVGGTLGALLTGIFASATVNPLIKDTFKGSDGKAISLEGGGGQLLNQFWAVLAAWCLAAVATRVILYLVDLVIGLRAKEHDESMGLDLSMHGEQAYN